MKRFNLRFWKAPTKPLVNEVNTQAPTEVQKFGRDILWVGFSQVLAFLMSILTLPVLTKSYISEVYGVWVQVLVTIGVLTNILTLYLGTALIRFVAGEENREKMRLAFGAMFWTSVGSAFTVLIAALLLKGYLSSLIFGDVRYARFVPLTFLWAFLQAVNTFLFTYFQARRRMKLVSVMQLLLSLLTVTLVTVQAIARVDLEWIITSLIILAALFLIANLSIVMKGIGFPPFKFMGIGHYLAFAFPYIPSGLLFYVINYSDRYFIAHFLDLPNVGIYSASYGLGNLIMFFISPLAFVLYPALAEFWVQGDVARVKNYLAYWLKLFLMLAIPGSAGLFVLSQPLLNSLTTANYATSGFLVLLIALGWTFYGLYQIGVCVVCLVEQTRWLPLVLGLCAVVNVIGNLVLLPRMGIIGAAISMFLSYILLGIIVTLWARRTVRYAIDFRFLIKVLLSAILMALVVSFVRVSNAIGIMLAALVGVVVFALGLLLLRAFSAEDRKLILEIALALYPGASK